MGDKGKGLYQKYLVVRTDGRSAPGERHDGCEYFVIDVTHDPWAIPALKAYAQACQTVDPTLYADLQRLIHWAEENRVAERSLAGNGPEQVWR